jgi:hypothetical protein
VRVLATGQLNTYDVLASEHIVFTEAALSAFTGQPAPAAPAAKAGTAKTSTAKTSTAKAGTAKASTAKAGTAKASKPEPGSADAAEPKAPRRRTTPKEGDEQ